jgi:hypothetical protein
MNEGQNKYFENMVTRHKIFEKKQSISKRFLKMRSNFETSKIHNYHLVKVFKKMISHFILIFYFSRHT